MKFKPNLNQAIKFMIPFFKQLINWNHSYKPNVNKSLRRLINARKYIEIGNKKRDLKRI